MTGTPPPAEDRLAFSTLIDWLDGRLPAEQIEQVSARLVNADAGSRHVLDWLRRFRRLAAALPLVDPPPVVRQRLQQDFQRWDRVRRASQAPLPIHPADLIFDSRQDLASPVGVRGPQPTPTAVHLAFSCEVADVVVDLTPHDAAFLCEGQVLASRGEADGAFEVVLRSGAGQRRSIEGGTDGTFRLADVPHGPASLELTNGLVVIRADLPDVSPHGDRSA